MPWPHEQAPGDTGPAGYIKETQEPSRARLASAARAAGGRLYCINAGSAAMLRSEVAYRRSSK